MASIENTINLFGEDFPLLNETIHNLLTMFSILEAVYVPWHHLVFVFILLATEPESYEDRATCFF